MDETIKKVNELLKLFNKTFEIEASLVKDGDEIVADGMKIKRVKNDGSEFIANFHDTFNTIIQSISNDHEVIYDNEKGLAVARKVIKTEYIIED